MRALITALISSIVLGLWGSISHAEDDKLSCDNNTISTEWYASQVSLHRLVELVRNNPDRLTYVRPPHPEGMSFLLSLVEFSAGRNALPLSNWNVARLDMAMISAFEILAELHPYMWRNGRSFPANSQQLHSLSSVREVDGFFDGSETGKLTLQMRALSVKTPHAVNKVSCNGDYTHSKGRTDTLSPALRARLVATWLERFGPNRPVCGCLFRSVTQNKPTP
jgi:hypothetical protein